MENVSDIEMDKGEACPRPPAGRNRPWNSLTRAEIYGRASQVVDGFAGRLANLRPSNQFSSRTRYLIVAGLIAVGLIARWGLHSVFGGDFPFEFFFVVIAFAAGFAGFGPALAAAAIGYVLADWLFLPPHYQLSSRTVSDWSGTLVYLGGGLTVVGLGHMLGKRHRRLEQEVLEISEREQQRIGQDLHDGLGQHLTGTGLLAHMLHQKLASKSLPEAAEAAKIMRLVKQATAQTRALARGLHPLNLEAGGLTEALQELTTIVQECSNISCRFETVKGVTVHDNGKAMHLYRIAQEAVNNSLKHSRANRIDIRLFKRGEGVVLIVNDDGVGIPAAASQARGGMGLRVMQHRAKLIGARLTVERAGESGTMMTCVLAQPL